MPICPGQVSKQSAGSRRVLRWGWSHSLEAWKRDSSVMSDAEGVFTDYEDHCIYSFLFTLWTISLLYRALSNPAAA